MMICCLLTDSLFSARSLTYFYLNFHPFDFTENVGFSFIDSIIILAFDLTENVGFSFIDSIIILAFDLTENVGFSQFNLMKLIKVNFPAF